MRSNTQFKSVCAPLVNNGYTPIPVSGKKAFLLDWQTTTPAQSLVLAKKNEYANNNVGLMTGVGACPIFAADFDFYDSDTVGRIVESFVSHFGQGLIRFGNKPKALFLYRGAQPHSKITSQKYIDPANPVKADGKTLYQGFELLGQGQQFVAFGLHPVTNSEYEWLGDNPLNIRAEDLPVLDVQKVKAWVDRVLPSLVPLEYDVVGSASTSNDAPIFETEEIVIVTEETVSDIASAIDYFTEADADDRDLWIAVGQALKTLPDQEMSLELFHRFAKKSRDKYDEAENDQKFAGFKADRTSYRSVFAKAQAKGWINPKSNEARRRAQIALNRAIGEGETPTTTNEVLTLEDMLERFVYQSQGQQLSDRKYPHSALKLADARMTYGASRMQKTDKAGNLREVECLNEFMRHPARPTTYTRTFIAGGADVVHNEDGLSCFNTFTPFRRNKANSLKDTSQAQPFLDHINWLFGDRAEEFLDWLAHIEQSPGVLPHTAWLHIANKTGLGRNWISSVLVRVWPGYVASNYDLVEGLSSSYNGQLSHKLLAQVDELNEAQQAQGKWQFAERLKGMLNCEYRNINPKYGMQTREKNACRFLLFSNHTSAIPLDKEDRRLQVVICNEKPRGEEYYTELYKLLGDEFFIASVARFLMDRDIRAFNPGEKAKMTEAKSTLVDLNQSPCDQLAQQLVDLWPFDLVPSSLVNEGLKVDPTVSNGSIGHSKERAGITSYIPLGAKKPAPLRIDGELVRINILRNHEQWLSAPVQEVKDELLKSLPLVDEIRRGAIDLGHGSVSRALQSHFDNIQAV